MSMHIIFAIMNFCSSHVNAIPNMETHDEILSESYANEKWHIYDSRSPREHNLSKPLHNIFPNQLISCRIGERKSIRRRSVIA